MNHEFVYIIKNKKKVFKIGRTDDLEKKLDEHKEISENTSIPYLKDEIKLVFSIVFYKTEQAVSFEKLIKSWPNKKLKALINQDYDFIMGKVEKRTSKDSIQFDRRDN